MKSSKTQLLALLADVKDPEIPVLDVVEMGIVRDVCLEDGVLRVDITPTYSGCPAMKAIEMDIVRTMQGHGFEQVDVRTVFEAAWTTDWMTEAARQKLRAYGIAPPEAAEDTGWLPFAEAPKPVACPFCGSEETTLTSHFGATACKALRFCNHCEQPFEHFKCH